jgi:hypothetical protein
VQQNWLYGLVLGYSEGLCLLSFESFQVPEYELLKQGHVGLKFVVRT